jgi:4-hydroxy-tetrahydrodipicolinate reductase
MHKAHNRKGFALGSVVAAEFLKDKRGLYNMDNLIS